VETIFEEYHNQIQLFDLVY